MSYKSLVCLVTLLSLCVGQVVRLDPSELIPLHYNIETTIDLNVNKFISHGSILIHLLKDVNEIKFFASGLRVAWFSSVLEDEDGETFRPIGNTIGIDGSYTGLVFDEQFEGGSNYTLHFLNVEGDYGRGFVEVLSPPKYDSLKILQQTDLTA